MRQVTYKWDFVTLSKGGPLGIQMQPKPCPPSRQNSNLSGRPLAVAAWCPLGHGIENFFSWKMEQLIKNLATTVRLRRMTSVLLSLEAGDFLKSSLYSLICLGSHSM